MTARRDAVAHPALTYGYSVCGLRVRATRPLPGLAPADGNGRWDVVIRVGALPPEADRGPAGGPPLYASTDRDEAGRPLLSVRRLAGAAGFLLQYADGTAFVVDRAGEHVWLRWPAPWTLDDAATYLVGPVLAFVLRRRGVTCLHASAVALGERAVALVGPPGAGKSTLAAVFSRCGHATLADDVVALRRCGDTFLVQPGPTRIRLWPESVAALYGSPDALPRLTPTWDKRFVDLVTHGGYGPRPLPLAAVYLLTDRDRAAALPCVERLSSVESVMALVANTSTNYLLDDALRAQEFAFLGDLVSAVPVRRLVSDDDPAVVPALCAMVAEDVACRDAEGYVL